jgi:hypothetical protein
VLGWGNIISKTRLKTRQRTSLVNSFKYSGTSSIQLRRLLFSTFVLPHFTWLFGLYPLFTDTQRMKLGHLYFTLRKRIYNCQCWDDFTFSSSYNENPLDDLCFRYWEKYTKALSRSNDGFLLLEQSALNSHRSNWQEGFGHIRCLYRSRRFVSHKDVLGLALRWMAMHGSSDSVVARDDGEFLCFAQFSESF